MADSQHANQIGHVASKFFVPDERQAWSSHCQIQQLDMNTGHSNNVCSKELVDLFLLRCFTWKHFPHDLVNADDWQAFEVFNEVSDIEEIIQLPKVRSQVRHVLEFVKVLEEALSFISPLDFLEHLHDEFSILLEQHGVISFECDKRVKLVNKPRKAGPDSVAGSSNGLSKWVKTIISSLGPKALETRSNVVNDLKTAEISFVHLDQHLIKHFFTVLVRHYKGDSRSQDHKHFVLLCLVINKLGLLLVSWVVLELSSDSRVSARD